MNTSAIWTLQECAANAKLNWQTVSRWVIRHRIPVIRNGQRFVRIYQSDWEAFLLRHRVSSTSSKNTNNGKQKKQFAKA